VSFLAQFPGRCGECGGQLQGTEATFDVDDQVTHVRCPDDESVMAAAAVGSGPCPRCFCYHAGDC
jgi:hypothetical protein